METPETGSQLELMNQINAAFESYSKDVNNAFDVWVHACVATIQNDALNTAKEEWEEWVAEDTRLFSSDEAIAEIINNPDNRDLFLKCPCTYERMQYLTGLFFFLEPAKVIAPGYACFLR